MGKTQLEAHDPLFNRRSRGRDRRGRYQHSVAVDADRGGGASLVQLGVVVSEGGSRSADRGPKIVLREQSIERWQDIVPDHVATVAPIVIGGVVHEGKPELGSNQADVLAGQAK